MQCPNCGTPYDDNDSICPRCGQPLSNAHYISVRSHSTRRERKKKRHIFPVLLLILLLIAGGGTAGWLYYSNQVGQRCEEAVHDIFRMAHSMDFSSVDPSYLPPALQENPDIRDAIDTYVQEALDQYGVGGLLEDAGIEIDSDLLCEAIVQDAHYEIYKSEIRPTRCRIYVRTANTDFSKLPETLAGEIENSLSGSSFWDSLRDLFSSIFSGHRHDAPEEDNEELLSSLLEDCRASAPTTRADGVFEFGIANGSWTLLSMDEELFYSYYGFSSLPGQ